MRAVKTALISVWDKTGVLDLAKTLDRFGTRIISTGGTAKALRESGIQVVDISEITKKPEAFGGRMKTLSYEVASGILFDRDRDADEAARLGIEPIDMVVCNLYPFCEYRDKGLGLNELIEYVDIGGPTMIRAAAKNFRGVAVLTRPGDYAAIIEELNANNGALSLATRTNLMRIAYSQTAAYDSAIADHMDGLAGQPSVRLHYSGAEHLRYGENPHQQAVYFAGNDQYAGFRAMEILGGKEISYNNLVDLAGALDAVADLEEPSVAIIKHTNPCGLCSAPDLRHAFELAWAADPVSAFGSVIAFNRTLTVEAAAFLDLDHEDKGKRKFVEIVAAPDFAPGVVEYLKKHKALRILKLDPKASRPPKELKFVRGALLVQDNDEKLFEKMEQVTQYGTGPIDESLLKFGLVGVRQVKSNSIVVVRRKGDAMQLLGMGSGQPNRVNSTSLAMERAVATLEAEYEAQGGAAGEAKELWIKEQLGLAYLVSDAFFPFPDSVRLAAAYGIRQMFQPGGSIRDKEVIAACDELHVAMVMTGIRHFKH